MSEWEELVEDGQTFYVNDDIGNIMKLSDGSYVVVLPRAIKLGTFSTLEEAKQIAEDPAGLDQTIENYNLHLTGLMKDMK